MVTVAIIITLMALIIPFSKSIAASATKAGCISNLRALHTGFAAYMQDHGTWPQLPYDEEYSDEQYENFWITSLHPYLNSDDTWLCPALKRMQLKDGSGRVVKMHYVPTQFDANPISPTRWPTQPWLIEQASVHGGGPLIIFPDGSVQSLNDLLKKAKSK